MPCAKSPRRASNSRAWNGRRTCRTASSRQRPSPMTARRVITGAGCSTRCLPRRRSCPSCSSREQPWSCEAGKSTPKWHSRPFWGADTPTQIRLPGRTTAINVRTGQVSDAELRRIRNCARAAQRPILSDRTRSRYENCAHNNEQGAHQSRVRGFVTNLPILELLRRHRPGDVIALGGVAAEIDESFPRRFGLDAFGDDFEVQPMPEIDRRFDDGCGDGVVRDRQHEGLVDLDRVDGQFVQIAEARIPDAEFVDEKLDAQRLDAPAPL